MKLLTLIDDPFMIAIIIGQLIYIFSLRKRMAGLNDPRLYLSRGERRAWARKELAEQDEDRQIEQFERNANILRDTPKENQ